MGIRSHYRLVRKLCPRQCLQLRHNLPVLDCRLCSSTTFVPPALCFCLFALTQQLYYRGSPYLAPKYIDHLPKFVERCGELFIRADGHRLGQVRKRRLRLQ